MLKEYERLGTPDILFSAEKNCWPPMLETEGYCILADLQEGADASASKFLSSGGVIGRAGPLARLWKTLIKQEVAHFKKFSSRGQYWDDQGTIALSYLIGNLFDIVLDLHSVILNLPMMMCRNLAKREGLCMRLPMRNRHIDRKGSRKAIEYPRSCTSTAMQSLSFGRIMVGLENIIAWLQYEVPLYE